ncbi:hypothetical protein K458DRAFT_424120 [Lentithecium fluviatile CBS 122367]|uniref:Uncharacterized protein n=1 Tax=Lentithecium fluviatile CBS 122367 TaxID=1168545 RepID=A0A6G1IGP3_9PLEO|nr:hypothetical protein K458DRAFT_424120 [Lentithecium fluviatile CBS 122367]
MPKRRADFQAQNAQALGIRHRTHKLSRIEARGRALDNSDTPTFNRSRQKSPKHVEATKAVWFSARRARQR